MIAPSAWAQCSFSNPTACGSPGVNNLAIGGTLSATGGGTISGSFAGTPTYSGLPTFNLGLKFANGANNNGTLTSQANWGFLLRGYSGAVADGGLQASDGTVPVRITTNNGAQVGYLSNFSLSQTLSGAQTVNKVMNMSETLSGSTTSPGNTSNNLTQIGTTTTANIPTLNLVYEIGQVNAGWDGSIVGNYAHLTTAGATSGTTSYMVAQAGQSDSNVNLGGSASGFGTTSFGTGFLFGADFVALALNGATFLREVTAHEDDCQMNAGSSAGILSCYQLVLQGTHAVHGTIVDNLMSIAAQNTALVGVKNVIDLGRYDSQWPVDPNGYIFQAQNGVTYGSFPATAAAGFDLLQATFNGAGADGGGFAFRTQGASTSISATAIDGGGALKLGSAYLNPASASTLTLDTGLYSYNGISSIVSGGTNYTASDLVDDGYGNVFVVSSVSSGAVTGLTLKYRAEGKTAAPSVSNLAFNTLVKTGPSIGSGLTVTENAWTQAGTTLNIGNTTATVINIGNTSANVLLGGGSALATNATVGFPLIPSSAGAPTGTVAGAAAGKVAIEIDTTNKKLCYTTGGGTWECSAAFTP